MDITIGGRLDTQSSRSPRWRACKTGMTNAASNLLKSYALCLTMEYIVYVMSHTTLYELFERIAAECGAVGAEAERYK